MVAVSRVAAVAGALLAGACLLAGCATSHPTESPTGLVVSPVAGDTATATASASVSLPAVAPLPAGSKWVTSAGHGVKFAVPSTWAMFDLTTFSDPAARAALAPLAAKVGKSVDEYVRDLAQGNDLIVTGPAKNGYSPSISVLKQEAQTVGDVPTTQQAQADVAGLKGTVTGVGGVLTPLGPGYAVSYSRPGDAAGVTLYCATLGLPSIKNTAYLASVESDTAAERDSLVNTLVRTLQKA